MTSDLKPLAMRTGGTLDCRLAFRVSPDEKRTLTKAMDKLDMSLGEYVLALHRYYQGIDFDKISDTQEFPLGTKAVDSAGRKRIYVKQENGHG